MDVFEIPDKINKEISYLSPRKLSIRILSCEALKLKVHIQSSEALKLKVCTQSNNALKQNKFLCSLILYEVPLEKSIKILLRISS